MIRVLHCITGLEIGGAEMDLFKLVQHTDRHRFQHCVISLLEEGALGCKIQGNGTPVYALRTKSLVGCAAALPRMAGLVRTFQPDVLQGWMYHGNLAATFCHVVSGKRTPLLWNILGDHTDLTFERPVTSVVIRSCALFAHLPWKIINNSHRSASAHVDRFRYPQEKWHILPNGFDTRIFAPSDTAGERLRTVLQIPAHAFVIGHVANYCPPKNHAAVLEAMARLSRRWPDVHLVMIGRGVDSHNSVLAKLVRESGIADKVHLLGERTDIAQMTAAFDVATNASIAEGFPNAVGEAMSCGIPCVVTDVGASALLVGDTGRVIRPGDVMTLAQAWDDLITAGGEYRRALGKRARERIMTSFAVDAFVGQYERLYESAASMHLAERISTDGITDRTTRARADGPDP